MVSHLLLLSCELDFSRKGAPECIRPPRSAESQTVRKSELGLHPRHAWGWMIFIISDKAVILQLVSRSIPPIVQNTPAEMKWGSPLPTPLTQMQSIVFGPQGFDASHCLCHLEHFWARLWTSLLPHLWKKVNDTSSVGWLVWSSNRTALSKCL